MSDAADEAKDPVLSTPGDKEREPGVERTDLGADDVPPRKRPGRPKGSKAKAKEPLTQTALAAASEAKDLRKL